MCLCGWQFGYETYNGIFSLICDAKLQFQFYHKLFIFRFIAFRLKLYDDAEHLELLCELIFAFSSRLRAHTDKCFK